MATINEKYGFNAGKIWNTLNTYGPLNETTLIKKTNLGKNEFWAAIGWLARENKVFWDGRYWQLGETNLTYNIGQKAGEIYNLLYTMKEANITYITNKISTSEKDTFYAVGWLAREDKIHIVKDRTKTNSWKVKLKY